MFLAKDVLCTFAGRERIYSKNISEMAPGQIVGAKRHLTVID